jgi:hypothetical protein
MGFMLAGFGLLNLYLAIIIFGKVRSLPAWELAPVRITRLTKLEAIS